jgi:hypothetical protein
MNKCCIIHVFGVYLFISNELAYSGSIQSTLAKSKFKRYSDGVGSLSLIPENTKGGSITVLLTSCLTGLD